MLYFYLLSRIKYSLFTLFTDSKHLLHFECHLNVSKRTLVTIRRPCFTVKFEINHAMKTQCMRNLVEMY